MKNIIDKDTGVFLRNDYVCNEKERIIEVAIPYNMYAVMGKCPIWNGEKWVQNIELPEPKPQPQEPTESERIEALEQALLEIVLGGGF